LVGCAVGSTEVLGERKPVIRGDDDDDDDYGDNYNNNSSSSSSSSNINLCVLK